MRALLSGLALASVVSLGLTAGATEVAAQSAADQYPSRTITIIVPWPPGASNDLSARAIAYQMSQILGQTIIVDNMGGAAGSRGSAAGARAAPDGYTLTFGNTTSHATNMVSFTDLAYHPIDDFEPIGLVHRSTMTVAVNKDAGIESLDDLIDYLKANPTTAYATPGVGTPQHMIGEKISHELGLDLTHIPYKGGAPALNDLMAGHVKVSTGGLSNFLGYHRTGELRIVAIAAPERHPDLPDVPTLAERFPDLVVSGWGSLHAPKGTDPAIIAKLSDAARQAVASEAVANTLSAAGLEPFSSSGEELEAQIRADVAAWQALLDQGVQLQQVR